MPFGVPCEFKVTVTGGSGFRLALDLKLVPLHVIQNSAECSRTRG